MKNSYYRNWYQHYKQLQIEKEKTAQIEYFSDFKDIIPDEGMNAIHEEGNDRDDVKPKDGKYRVKHDSLREEATLHHTFREKNERNFNILGFLLPISTMFGFLFLWYNLGIGVAPFRLAIEEVAAFVGLNHSVDETALVIEKHESLMDMYYEINRQIQGYIESPIGVSTNLAEMIHNYQSINDRNENLDEISNENFPDLARMRKFKLMSLSEMMTYIIENDTITDEMLEVYGQFTIDQNEIRSLINHELELLTDDEQLTFVSSWN